MIPNIFNSNIYRTVMDGDGTKSSQGQSSTNEQGDSRSQNLPHTM